MTCRAGDVAALSHGTQTNFLAFRRVPLAGNSIVIIGDLERARFTVGKANLTVQGNLKMVDLEEVNGTVTVGSVSQGSRIEIKQEAPWQ